MELLETKPYRLSRKMYIAEAALEYLVSILVTGAFLARLTTSLGFSDSLTGILSAIVSLGCIFQLSSVLIQGRRMKPLVIVFSLLSEVLFLLLYIIPVTPLSGTVKTISFVVFLIAAYLVSGVISTKKMSWLMSLVDDRKRGSFTANKEIISLAAGILFSFLMGRIIDSYQAEGELRQAFVLCAVVIVILTVLHTLTLIFSVERPLESGTEKKNMLSGFRSVLSDKVILTLTMLFVLYRVGTYTATSFYGTYQIKELGFSQTLVVILSSSGSLVRMACSRFMGRYADRNSFAKMERICLGFLMVGYVLAALATPKTGKVFFTLYYVMNGIAMAGANSALTNLIFDYVPLEKRADSLAVCQAISGLAGFLATLAASSLVSYIQTNGNTFLGISLYAQQVTSLIAALIMGICIVYVTLVFIKGKQKPIR